MSHSSIASRARAARPFLAIAFVAALASCGASGIEGIAKNYTLQTAEGAPLPFTVPGAQHDLVITSGTAKLSANGNYTFTYTGTTDGTAGTVASDDGSWTVGSSTIIFTSAPLSGATYIAALVGSTINVSVPGVIFNSSRESVDMVFSLAQ